MKHLGTQQDFSRKFHVELKVATFRTTVTTLFTYEPKYNFSMHSLFCDMRLSFYQAVK